MLRITSIVLAGCLVAGVSCTSDKKDVPASTEKPTRDGGMQRVDITKGVAGGTVEQSFTAVATVRGVDLATRKITLEGEGGTSGTFTAPPEMRNLEQLKVGDTVRAKILQKLEVKVNEPGTTEDAYTSAAMRTPKGAKPGVLYAESFEVVGTVESIDKSKREAVLRFNNDQAETIPVREDVDLSKYKVGDRVVIRVTERLSLLTSTH